MYTQTNNNMILKNINGQEVTLMQVTNENNGDAIGLYLIPKGVEIEAVEYVLTNATKQNAVDEVLLSLGVERIYAYDSILDIKF